MQSYALASLALLLHNHSDNSKYLQMGTKNVNTTKEGNVLYDSRDELFAKMLVYMKSFTYVKHMQLCCSSSSNQGFTECKLACLFAPPAPHGVSHPPNHPVNSIVARY